MTYQPIFRGLIYDEADQVVEVAYVGDDPCYVVDDSGFQRHISSEYVDRQVLEIMKETIQGHEELLVEQTAKMLGQEDIFTLAMIQNQLKNIDKQLDTILTNGIPEEGKTYMGMMGFKITINVHGEVTNVVQPGIPGTDEE
jgi:hypothetical protein